jgi:DNA-directed RNA polymerase subunit RPC12/RpoP
MGIMATAILEMHHTECITCKDKVWSFPQTQEEVTNFKCYHCSSIKPEELPETINNTTEVVETKSEEVSNQGGEETAEDH